MKYKTYNSRLTREWMNNKKNLKYIKFFFSFSCSHFSWQKIPWNNYPPPISPQCYQKSWLCEIGSERARQWSEPWRCMCLFCLRLRGYFSFRTVKRFLSLCPPFPPPPSPNNIYILNGLNPFSREITPTSLAYIHTVLSSGGESCFIKVTLFYIKSLSKPIARPLVLYLYPI